ncbi:DEAD-box ATP-dependent RNA helicase 38 [Dioscorea cayenensis subsp. rotundata]|uniref:RNA helicase n=1 Tax=Dioscorea cayennensis subsp. rotundata TaxID=55577 RepID=A0AB40AL12_DIOCR|nr:DEAD-box ATP-dependent RNA helicase 38 [Dioscorea cayenensis subsp. rotundata]
MADPAKTEEKRRAWGDEDEEEDSSSVASSSLVTAASVAAEGKAAEGEASELKKIEELSITEKSRTLDDPEDSEIKAVTSGNTVYEAAVKFEDLNLSQDLIKGLYVEMGFTRPSKIQAVSLPMILTPPYKDLVAQAHNGSGKTTCFVLGMLSRVDPTKEGPQAMCICPTRELAQQNQAVLMRMGKYSGITSMCAIPSESAGYIPVYKRPEVKEHVVIGTPGTIKKLMTGRKLKTGNIKILVFDEADHMLAEGGFKDDSERIMKDIRKESGGCQVLLFSATFNETVKAFVSNVVRDGNQIFVKKEDLTLEKVKQYKVKCYRDRERPDERLKIEVIKKILEYGQKVGQTIIFVRTKESARNLHKQLSSEGYECTSIQGALVIEDRDKIIKEFKDGLTQVLITTDLLARGFDQAQVNLVVNHDLPVNYESYRRGSPEPDCEVYLHRVGRTGRFGRKGAVFNLLGSRDDEALLEMIENHFQHKIPMVDNGQNDDSIVNAIKDAGLL